MKIIGRLLDKLPGVDQLLSHPRAVLIAACAGVLLGMLVAILW